MKKNRESSRLRRIVIPTVLLLLLAGGVYLGYRTLFDSKPPTTLDGQPVNLEQATDEEKAQSESHKENIVERDKALQESANTPGASNVTVVITGSDQTTGRAYITGVFEDGGSCLATATMGGATAKASSVGFKNVSYTQCAPLDWDFPLTPGNWNITVTYKSSAAEGSQTRLVEVK